MINISIEIFDDGVCVIKADAMHAVDGGRNRRHMDTRLETNLELPSVDWFQLLELLQEAMERVNPRVPGSTSTLLPWQGHG